MGEFEEFADGAPKPATAGEFAEFATTEQAPEAPPGLFERIGRGFKAIGHTVKTGATVLSERPRQLFAAQFAPEGQQLDAAMAAITGAVEDIKDPAKRHELERGLDNMVTLGYGQRLAARIGNAAGDVERGTSLNETRRFSPDIRAGSIGGPSEIEARERLAAPGYQELGTLLGVGSPGAATAIGKAGGGLVKAATGGINAASLPARVGLGVVQGVGGYEATAPLTAALSASAEGNRLGAAREAATDPTGIVLAGTAGGGAGLVSKISEGAPGRVAARRAKDVTTGEQNAPKKLTEKVQERAGEGGERLDEVLAQYPDLDRVISIKAGSSPGKVVKAVKAKTREIGDELHDIYANMEKSGRVVTPSDIAVEFDKLLGRRLAGGDQPAVRILRQERARFLDEYGNFGHLSANTMRGLKATAGKGAFEGMPIPGSVQADIWGVYSSAIERQAEKSKDLARLRTLNRDMSVLIPVEKAIADRATSEAAGRRSFAEHVARGTLAAGGLAHGGVKEMIAGLVAPEVFRGVGQGIRAIDYGLAKRFQGAAPELSSGAGGRTASLEYAARVSEGMRNGMSLADAVKAAGDE